MNHKERSRKDVRKPRSPGSASFALKGQYAFSIIAFTPDGKTTLAGSSESTKLYDVREK